MLKSIIRFFLENKLVAWLLLLVFVGWGLATAPFDFGPELLPRDPVAVDAIPDIGENQQIVFTKWAGRSPQDVEDQITYPLTTALLGVPGVKSIRSNSMFGFSSIYIIFKEDIEFYWSRSRILEKLNSLPANTLPDGVQPTLGPDATALGQIYWYTLEGRDKEGNPTGGWDLHELRTIQDFYVRFGLSSAQGVSEVASIGGFVKEYQVDVDPEAMKANGVTLEQVMNAIKKSNLDVGAQTMEINLAEYFVRGLGYVEHIEDIEQTTVAERSNVPLRIKDIARVQIAPATRRGVLDKSGAEAVGGVVIARYGANPMEVINNVKEKIDEIAPGLPGKYLADSTWSKVTIVPFYDRTELINETLGTLEEALSLEILITIIVIILMLFNLKSSLLVSGSLPVAVLMCFIAMRYFGVDANIVALSGIAIAIGTMVDMGIVLTESMVKRIDEAPPDETLLESIYEATVEVASAVITAVATTVISFLPVFTMEASEGKLFKPLAFTKTFALIASIIVAITIIPPLAHSIFSLRSKNKAGSLILNILAIAGGITIWIFSSAFLGSIVLLVGLFGLLKIWLDPRIDAKYAAWSNVATNIIYALIVGWLLATVWMPLGVNKTGFTNFLFIGLIAGGLLSFFYVIIHFYENILRFLLRFKVLFLLLVGFIVYQGFAVFKNTGQEFMPALDEGAFLLMPTAMPHSGMQENIKNLRLLDMAVTAIPEVKTVVGKAGRINSALDPAPMSMYENVILYKSEYKTDAEGHRIRYRFEKGEYTRDEKGELIPDASGRYFRQWRDHIQSPDDIWEEIVAKTKLPGVTSAPKLQPIETRLIMLQTGMRAPMGIKVRGPDLKTIEDFGIRLEQSLKEVEGVKESAVFADRIVGKPYLLLDINRQRIARFGLSIQDVQNHIQAAVGGMAMTSTVEGRERYSIRVRYPRELRDDPEALKRIYVTASNGKQIPLGDLIDIRYEQGPQAIKSEDGFLVGYVLFDRLDGFAEVDVVNNAQALLNKKIEDGSLEVPPGVSYRFAGNYEQQLRANKRLSIVLPIALAIIFLILYFQFSSVTISAMVFTGVFIAFAGGFIMIGLYDTPWFLDFEIFGTNMRDLFQIQTINLSVAVWVGFLALFGIATDDGVLVATFLKDSFKKNKPTTIPEIRDAVVEGGLRRVRPAMMTTATTILALLPILTSTGRGSDIMVPMAIPSFGGMTLQMITMFTVPVLFSLWQEWSLHWEEKLSSLKKRSSFFGGLMAIALLIPVSSQSQSPDSLVIQALDNNLELKVLEKTYEASLQRAPQVSQLPQPEVGVGAFPLPVETRLGAQIVRVGATQMFPWKGLLDSRKDLENAKSRALFKKIAVRALDIQYQVKKAWLELYLLEEKIAIISANLPLLEALEKLALAKVESGKGSTADVLRVQLSREALLQQIEILQQQKREPIANLNQLLGRKENAEFHVRDSLILTALPYQKDSVLAMVKALHPQLEMLGLEQDIARQASKVNELEGKPSFGVGLDYIMVNGRTDANPANNGRDIVQLRGAVTIPIYRKKYEAKAMEEQLKIEALDLQKEDTFQKYTAAIEKAYAQHEMAQLRASLAERQKQLTLSTIEILESKYSADGNRFDELLRLEKDLIDYDLQMLQAIVQSHLAKISIERFFQQ